jgi:hypothetical protein
VPDCTVVFDILSFCVLNSIVSYEQSKRIIKVGSLIVAGLFVASRNFHSIMIVVPLHVSNFLEFSKS